MDACPHCGQPVNAPSNVSYVDFAAHSVTTPRAPLPVGHTATVLPFPQPTDGEAA